MKAVKKPTPQGRKPVKVTKEKKHREPDVPVGTKAALYINSAGKCAVPDCGKHLVIGKKNISRVAHILPSSPNGPRGKFRTTQDVNDLSNLILVCNDHHDVIDSKAHEDEYPPELLTKWKENHEKWAAKQNPKDPASLVLVDVYAQLSKSIDISGNLVGIIDKAETLIQDNEFESAELIIDAVSELVVGKDQLQSKCQILKARIAWKQEQYDQAKIILDEILKSDPNNEEAIYLQCEILLDDQLDITGRLPIFKQDSAYANLLKSRWKIYNPTYSYEFEKYEIITGYKPFEQIALYLRYAVIALIDEDKDLAMHYISKAESINPLHPNIILIKANILLVDFTNSDDIDKDKTEKFKADTLATLEPIRGTKLSHKQKIEFLSYEIRADLFSIRFGRPPETREKLEEYLALIEATRLTFVIKEFLKEYLSYFHLNFEEYERIIKYLQKNSNNVSVDLSELLIPSFMKYLKDDESETILKSFGLDKYNGFIKAIREGNGKKAAQELLHISPDRWPSLVESILDDSLRLTVLENISNDELVLKFLRITTLRKLGRSPEALPIIKSIQSSELTYEAAYKTSFIAEENKVWEVAVSSLERLIPMVTDESEKAEYLLRIINAYDKLKNDAEVSKHSALLRPIQSSLTPHNLGLFSHIVMQSYLRAGDPAGAISFAVGIPSESRNFGDYIFLSDAYAQIGDGENALNSIFNAFDVADAYPGQNFIACYQRLITIYKLLAHTPTELKVEEGKFVKIDKLNKWFFIGNIGETWDAIRLDPTHENYKALINHLQGDIVEWPSAQYSTEKTRTIQYICNREEYLHSRAIEEMEIAAEGGAPYVWRVSVEEKNFENVIKLMQEQEKPIDEFFELYSSQRFPFGALITRVGSTLTALSKIVTANKGFVHSTIGNPSVDEIQIENAITAINANAPIYIDGTVAAVLCFTDNWKILDRQGLDLILTPSVINDLRTNGQKFSSVYNISEGRLGLHEGKLNYQQTNVSQEAEHRKRFFDTAQSMAEKYKVEAGISKETLLRDWDYNNIFPTHIAEPYTYANQKSAYLLTDDYYYAEARKVTGGQVNCLPFSSLSLFRALLSLNKITLREYLEFSGWLAHHRYKHVPISDDLLYAAVVNQDTPIAVFNTDNIRLLNLRLTLSEEYGVTLENSANVVAGFFWKILNDESIPPEFCNDIFDLTLSQAMHKRDGAKYAGIIRDRCNGNAKSKLYVSNSFKKKLQMLNERLKNGLLYTFNSAKIIIPPKK